MKCCPTAKNDATMTPQVTKMADEQASAAPVVSAASLISLKRSSAGEEAVVRPPVHAAAKMPSSQLILISKKRCLGPKRRSKSKLPFVVIAVRVPPWNQVPTQKPVVPVVVPARSPVLSNRFWFARWPPRPAQPAVGSVMLSVIHVASVLVRAASANVFPSQSKFLRVSETAPEFSSLDEVKPGSPAGQMATST